MLDNIKCNFLLNINDKTFYCEKRQTTLTSVSQCYACKKCEKCINNNTTECNQCSDNFIYALIPQHSYFQNYKPVCPRGYTDCVNDPACIKFYDPEWYTELFGNKTPEEAIHEENGCWDSFQKDPEMNYYCYDDEDK